MMLKTQFSSKVDLSGFGTELFNYSVENKILREINSIKHDFPSVLENFRYLPGGSST